MAVGKWALSILHWCLGLVVISYLLYSTVTTERPVQVNVVKVKKSDKGDFYKRQTAWVLRDLAVVDAKDAIKVCLRYNGLKSSLCMGSKCNFHL